MSCTGTYATALEFFSFWGRDCPGNEAALEAESFLEITASDIHAALAASGACDCTLASWATVFLKKLNIIDAAVLYVNSCIQLTDEQRKMFLDWISTQLSNIRNGTLELCSGETGSEYPAIGWAEQSVTEFAAAQIVLNDMQEDA